MWLIEKMRRGRPMHAVRMLSIDERRAIVQAWAGNRAQKESVQGLLKRIQEQEQWLACDCSDREDPPSNPVLFIVRDRGGRMGLRRNDQQHDVGCPFYWDEEADAPVETGVQAETLSTVLLRFLKSVQATQFTEAEAFLAMDACITAGDMNLLYPSFASHQSLKQLRDRVADDGGKVPLWTSDKWLTEGWAQKALLRSNEDYGLYVGVAKSFRGNFLELASGGVEVLAGNCIFPGGQSGPSLVMAIVEAQSPRLRAVLGYPSVDMLTVPVRCEPARSVGSMLARLAHETTRRFAGSEILVRSSFAADQPDFTVVLDGHRLQIVVIRSAMSAHLAEARMRADALTKWGQVIIDWRARNSISDGNRELARKFFGWVSAVRQKA